MLAPAAGATSTGGSKITAFTYASFGCFGAGGFGTGDPWTSPFAIHKVGNISVSKKGKFSANNVVATYTSSQGYKTVTTTSVAGKFTAKTKASGTLTFSQHLTGPHSTNQKCGPATLTFSVKHK